MSGFNSKTGCGMTDIYSLFDFIMGGLLSWGITGSKVGLCYEESFYLFNNHYLLKESVRTKIYLTNALVIMNSW
jgi:hypothetical protein